MLIYKVDNQVDQYSFIILDNKSIKTIIEKNNENKLFFYNF